jgi:tRNA-Thr(GGU) m(6)t(6)A37 methyltransferase TsaA
MDVHTVSPVGQITSTRSLIKDDDWGEVTCALTLDATRFTAEALHGIDAFSHLQILFLFDQVSADSVEHGARHPRGREDWPSVGIFAQRAKRRPNRIGLCVAELVGVDLDTLTLHLKGLDAIDGTPVLDIKPYVREFDVREHTTQPVWMDELMKAYF